MNGNHWHRLLRLLHALALEVPGSSKLLVHAFSLPKTRFGREAITLGECRHR